MGRWWTRSQTRQAEAVGPTCSLCDREATEFTWNGRYWCDEHYPLRRPTRPGLTIEVWRARGGDDAD